MNTPNPTPAPRVCKSCGCRENDHPYRHMFDPVEFKRTEGTTLTPAGDREAYRCLKPGCKANAWSPYADGWKCHYCDTPAHFSVNPPKAQAPVEDEATHADADALIRIMFALMVADKSEGDIPPTKRAWFDKAYAYSNARGDKSLRPTPKGTDTPQNTPEVQAAVFAAMDDLVKMDPEEFEQRINEAVGVLRPPAPDPKGAGTQGQGGALP